MDRSYTELVRLKTFDERLAYLNLNGVVGDDTFGAKRYLNQKFYTSYEWRMFRNKIIARDLGCDLGCEDHEILDGTMILIHHINPILPEDLLCYTEKLLDPENAITTILDTHNSIHYGTQNIKIPKLALERTPNDTKLW